MAKKVAVRRITAPKKAHINRLADMLYDFLPLTSRAKSTITFTSIFSKRGIKNYLQGADNKKQVLENALTEVYRRHERLPFTLIRTIVPAAINYRKFHRRPLTRDEITSLSNCLKDLGIDMENELSQVELDGSLPRITVPPKELKERLRGHDLEPFIASDPLDLFESGHFNEAVRKACELFENETHDLSGINDYGQGLMGKAFSDSTFIDLENLQPENRQDFVLGYKFLAMGVMSAIRNVFSHGDEERRSPEECFEMLMFINWMFRVLKRE